MKHNIPIPEGCNHLVVDIADDKVEMSFASVISRDFLCEETGETETRPLMGDMAVFWNHSPQSAIISRVLDVDLHDNAVYCATDGEYYLNAVRFRDDKQYAKILSYGK